MSWQLWAGTSKNCLKSSVLSLAMFLFSLFFLLGVTKEAPGQKGGLLISFNSSHATQSLFSHHQRAQRRAPNAGGWGRKKLEIEDFSASPVLRFHAPNAGGPSLIPGQGTRSHIPQLRVRMLQLKTPQPTGTYCTAQGTLHNIMWRPGWEQSLKENGYMCMYAWVLSLSTWNYHSTVNRLHSNIK